MNAAGAKIWFAGGGAFAASCLAHMSRSLVFEKILTGLASKAGRGLAERPSRVEEAALKLGLSVERTGPLSQNREIMERISSDPPDIVFVVDFAQLIREPLLNAPRHGCLNIHPSLLPRWRGAAPVQRALLNGDAVTGVTLFRLAEELDAGPILIQKEVPIPLAMTSTELFEILALAGSQIAAQGVKFLVEDNCQFSNQNSEFATYADKVSKAETQVFWDRDYIQIHNAVRAFASSAGAFTFFEGKRLKLWRTAPVGAVEFLGEGEPGKILCFMDGDPVVACMGGALRLLEVQSEGKRKASGADWVCGYRACGRRLEAGSVMM
jgi:methionyl-tRNA formyltransferase